MLECVIKLFSVKFEEAKDQQGLTPMRNLSQLFECGSPNRMDIYTLGFLPTYLS